MKDPLSLLGDLPDWPGNTPPKNRSTKQRRTVTTDLNGAVGKVYRINGEDVELFTIGELAKALVRKPVTIRMWEQQGWIPRAKFRTPTPQGQQLPDKKTQGRRLYTRAQVVFLVEAAQRFSLDDKNTANWTGFRNYVRENWPTQ